MHFVIDRHGLYRVFFGNSTDDISLYKSLGRQPTLRICHITAFPPQQWLHERNSMLRYSYSDFHCPISRAVSIGPSKHRSWLALQL